MRRGRFARQLSWAVALLLAACSGTTRPAPAPPGPDDPVPAAPSGTLRVAVDAPDDLLPYLADEPAEQWLADAIFDGLTRWGPDLRPVPAAAESWTVDPSQRVWTFRLRQGATWHDGEPVVAGDFVRGWRALAREGRLTHLLLDVEGVPESVAEAAAAQPAVRALDASTLEVRLRRPNADFPSVVAHPALAPLPPQPDQAVFAARPVGNGPFSMPEAWSPGRFVRVRRFPEWRNGAPADLDEILFQIMDPETAYLAFQQGRLHLAPVPAGALRQATADTAASVWQGERAALYLLGMDHTLPPFDRVEVRRAVGQAVDRAALAAQVSEGAAGIARGLLPSWLPESVDEPCPSCERDLVAARAAFEAAAVTVVRLSFNTGAGHETVARRVRADLARAGVTVELDARAPEEFFAAARAGELSLFRVGWQPDAPTADAILRPLLHSESVPRHGSDTEGLRHNLGRYRAPDVDALLDGARQTAAAPARAAQYREAARLALERDQALVPLFVYRHRLARAPDVTGVAPDPMGQVDWARVRVRPQTPTSRVSA